MRARYTAFARGDVDFIVESHHPDTREHVDREEVEQWSGDSEWLGLEILGTGGGDAGDDEGTVDFVARYSQGDVVHDHREHATFRRLDDGSWSFLDGEPLVVSHREQRTGRTRADHPYSRPKTSVRVPRCVRLRRPATMAASTTWMEGRWARRLPVPTST